MSRLIGVRGSELRDEDAEDVDEEDKVGQDAEQTGGHVDPLDPLLALGGQGPAEGVVHEDPQHAVRQARNHRQSCKTGKRRGIDLVCKHVCACERGRERVFGGERRIMKIARSRRVVSLMNEESMMAG